MVIPAPYFRRSVSDPRVKAFVDGVTAAATGAIAGAAFVLGRRAIFDVPTALICLGDARRADGGASACPSRW